MKFIKVNFIFKNFQVPKLLVILRITFSTLFLAMEPTILNMTVLF